MTETKSNVCKGKFGFYPCDWETYRKLKRLNMISLEHVKVCKKHDRWENKLPKNRVSKRWISNEAGQKIGYEKGEPIPEPRKGCESLYALIQVGKWIQLPITKLIFDDYKKARYPQSEEVMVLPLKFSNEEIDKLLIEAEKWYAEK